jgi:hypothetical protein
VLSAILAILLAMSLGFNAVVVIAIGLYVVAAATLRSSPYEVIKNPAHTQRKREKSCPQSLLAISISRRTGQELPSC